jgi:hypothetical protein
LTTHDHPEVTPSPDAAALPLRTDSSATQVREITSHCTDLRRRRDETEQFALPLPVEIRYDEFSRRITSSHESSANSLLAMA